MPKSKLPAFVSTFCLCYLIWVLLTWRFTAQELIAGAFVSAAVAFTTSSFFIHESAFWLLRPQRFLALAAYFPVFLSELVKANLDVAGRCFGGCRDVNPGIIKVPVGLKSDYGQAMLANSITLTPGTITLDIAEQAGQTWYYIHWIDVKEMDREKAGERIKGRLEKGIGRIWE